MLFIVNCSTIPKQSFIVGNQIWEKQNKKFADWLPYRADFSREW